MIIHKKRVVKITWSKDEPLKMVTLAEKVSNALYLVAIFVNPPVLKVDLDAASILVINLYPLRNDREEDKTNYSNALKDLDKKLHDLAFYVSSICNGDVVKIESSGFSPTSNERATTVRPEAPVAPKVKSLGGSRAKSIIPAKVPGAKKYTHIFFTDSASVFVIEQNQISMKSDTGGTFFVITGKYSEEVNGLPTLTKMYCGVIAQNAAGYSNMSTIVPFGVL